MKSSGRIFLHANKYNDWDELVNAIRFDYKECRIDFPMKNIKAGLEIYFLLSDISGNRITKLSTPSKELIAIGKNVSDIVRKKNTTNIVFVSFSLRVF